MSESGNTMDELPDDEKVAILKELRNDQYFGLVSVQLDKGDGILVYERGATRVGGEPAIEIPHEDPYLVDESDAPGVSPPPTTFDQMLDDYGCRAETKEGFTYITVIESEHNAPPAGEI